MSFDEKKKYGSMDAAFEAGKKKAEKFVAKFEDKKLLNRIFLQLNKLPEFKNLSMDRRAEISIIVEKMTSGGE